MGKFSVEFEIDVPVDATEEQVEEWLSFQLGETASIMCSNPLSSHDIEASNVVAWAKT
jgi:hypothetical protein